LRWELANNPKSALAAANLGMILLKKQEYEEARKWLQRALSMRNSLPDNGRRAEMEMRELERRASKHHASTSTSYKKKQGTSVSVDGASISEQPIFIEPVIVEIEDPQHPSTSAAHV
jgi:tetratricopeptide (TPR) repeat protein